MSARLHEVWGEVFNVGLRFLASVDGNDTCAVSRPAMLHFHNSSPGSRLPCSLAQVEV